MRLLLLENPRERQVNFRLGTGLCGERNLTKFLYKDRRDQIRFAAVYSFCLANIHHGAVDNIQDLRYSLFLLLTIYEPNRWFRTRVWRCCILSPCRDFLTSFSPKTPGVAGSFFHGRPISYLPSSFLQDDSNNSIVFLPFLVMIASGQLQSGALTPSVSKL